MSEALKVVVQSFIQLGNAKALQDMRTHRTKLLTDMRLRGNDAFNSGFYTDALEVEIAILDEGLARINTEAK